jgi:nitrogen regulatory protein P-II 1
MKKVEAVIKPEKLDQALDALSEIGYPGVTMTDVRGHGKQKGITHHWRGNEYRVKFIPKVKIEVVILDEDLPRTLDAIVRNSRTGNIGDGKVFVLDVEEAVRVRTGESGMKAI